MVTSERGRGLWSGAYRNEVTFLNFLQNELKLSFGRGNSLKRIYWNYMEIGRYGTDLTDNKLLAYQYILRTVLSKKA